MSCERITMNRLNKGTNERQMNCWMNKIAIILPSYLSHNIVSSCHIIIMSYHRHHHHHHIIIITSSCHIIMNHVTSCHIIPSSCHIIIVTSHQRIIMSSLYHHVTSYLSHDIGHNRPMMTLANHRNASRREAENK